jgi:DNA-binding NarL/FixJ family response regulator
LQTLLRFKNYFDQIKYDAEFINRPYKKAVFWRNTMSAPLYTLLIADDHPLFRGAMREAIQGLAASIAILEAESFESLSATLEKTKDIDLILLDLTMPGVKGFSGLLYIRAQYPHLPVMIVSGNSEPETIRSCFDFGASGFIPKTLDIEAMRGAIVKVLEGATFVPAGINLNSPKSKENTDMVAKLASLTPQQVRVLMMLSSGLLNKQIAWELQVSEATVKAHVSAILQKLDVESRTQAVIAASKLEQGTLNAG